MTTCHFEAVQTNSVSEHSPLDPSLPVTVQVSGAGCSAFQFAFYQAPGNTWSVPQQLVAQHDITTDGPSSFVLPAFNPIDGNCGFQFDLVDDSFGPIPVTLDKPVFTPAGALEQSLNGALTRCGTSPTTTSSTSSTTTSTTVGTTTSTTEAPTSTTTTSTPEEESTTTSSTSSTSSSLVENTTTSTTAQPITTSASDPISTTTTLLDGVVVSIADPNQAKELEALPTTGGDAITIVMIGLGVMIAGTIAWVRSHSWSARA